MCAVKKSKPVAAIGYFSRPFFLTTFARMLSDLLKHKIVSLAGKKTPLLFLFLGFQTAYLTSFSQATIVLNDKTVLKKVNVHHIYSSKIEYEKNGSLHDLLNSTIERIETDTAIISFEKNGNILSRPYDYIVKISGDTVFCQISQLGGNYVYYYAKGADNRSYISTASLKDYRKFEPQPLLITGHNAVNAKPQSQDPVYAEPTKTTEKNIANRQSTPDAVKPAPDTLVKITLYETNEEEKIPETEMKKQDENSEQDGILLSHSLNNDVCYESYMKGTRDASQKDEIIWGVGGFCLNGCCTFGFPAFTYWAVDKNDPVTAVPADVDERCYRLGYQNEKKQKRVKNAAIGGIAAVVVFLGVYLLTLTQLGGI